MSDLEETTIDNEDEHFVPPDEDDGESGPQVAPVEGESEKRQKFRDLASKRTSNLLDNIRLLGNLSNTSSYEYTQEDIEKIFGRIQEDLDETKEMFQPRKQKSTTFVL